MCDAKKMKILFLCTGNSCRSQMAEGWGKNLKGDTIDFYSAGVETHGLNPYAIKAMAEVSVDITTQKSQHIDEFKNIELDVVITVCDSASKSCPVFDGKTKVVHVPFDDPPKLAAELEDEEQKLNCYRKVRDKIKEFVQNLPENLKL
jgi:arsenate reductase